MDQNIATYGNIYEILNDIAKAPGNIKPAARWISEGEVIPCALRMAPNSEVYVEHLYSDGYGDSKFDDAHLNERYYLFKHLPVAYATAAFWPKEKKILYVDLMTIEQHSCTIIKWENRGYYCIFKVRLEGEEVDRELRASEYGKCWVFLDPET